MRVVDGIRAITQFFVLVGALAWGAMGLYQVNVISTVMGPYSSWFYSAIGISGIYLTYLKLRFS